MLRLVNIKKTNDYIEANYIPEDCESSGFVRMYLNDDKIISETVEGYETTYPSMAIKGLKNILESQKCEIPKEKVVMWY
ncbi:MAG: hypothetical protein IKJ17_03100 [Clostridia bacterium]|nr:hypothetical protein [Clostridia bacterium]